MILENAPHAYQYYANISLPFNAFIIVMEIVNDVLIYFLIKFSKENSQLSEFFFLQALPANLY